MQSRKSYDSENPVPFPAIRIGTDKSALEPVAVVGDLVCPYGIAVLIKSKRNPHL